MKDALNSLRGAYFFPIPSAFVFPWKKPGKPYRNLRAFYLDFYQALERIGIDESMRKARHLTMHAWRHYFNQKLRDAGIPLHVIQRIMGHTTVHMTDHYSHKSAIDYAPVIRALAQSKKAAVLGTFLGIP